MKNNIKICLGIFVLAFSLIILLVGCDDDEDDGFELLCDPSIPVVLNDFTLPANWVIRDPYGCVTGITINNVYIYDTEFLSGIDEYSSTLQGLEICWLDANEPRELNISYLSACTNLELLRLYNCNLSSLDLEGLSDCINLKWLYIGMNPFTEINLEPLRNCPNLLKIHLDCCPWLDTLDLAPLSYCINLEEINLSSIISNALSIMNTIDITPLASCVNLRIIDLSANTRMRSLDISPLWYLESLEGLYLQDNIFDSTTCAQICSFIEDHPDCYVTHNCDCE